MDTFRNTKEVVRALFRRDVVRRGVSILLILFWVILLAVTVWYGVNNKDRLVTDDESAACQILNTTQYWETSAEVYYVLWSVAYGVRSGGVHLGVIFQSTYSEQDAVARLVERPANTTEACWYNTDNIADVRWHQNGSRVLVGLVLLSLFTLLILIPVMLIPLQMMRSWYHKFSLRTEVDVEQPEVVGPTPPPPQLELEQHPPAAEQQQQSSADNNAAMDEPDGMSEMLERLQEEARMQREIEQQQTQQPTQQTTTEDCSQRTSSMSTTTDEDKRPSFLITVTSDHLVTSHQTVQQQQQQQQQAADTSLESATTTTAASMSTDVLPQFGSSLTPQQPVIVEL